MVIFHSYVSLPEGNFKPTLQDCTEQFEGWEENGVRFAPERTCKNMENHGKSWEIMETHALS